MSEAIGRFNSDLLSRCAELAEANSILESRLNSALIEIEKLKDSQHAEKNYLKLKIQDLQNQLYGKKSEKRKKFEADQSQLQFSFMLPAPEEDKGGKATPKITVKSFERKATNRKPLSRKDRFPEHLHRKIIQVPQEGLACPSCGHEMTHVIKTEVTQKLQCSRDPFFVEEIRRELKGCRGCEKVAPLPEVPEVFYKSCLGETVIAFILVNKFKFSIPLYRQVVMFDNWGVPISRDTFIKYCLQSAALLEPLYRELGIIIKGSEILLADETRFKACLVDLLGKRTFHQGTLWALLNPSGLVYCEFSRSKNHDTCSDILEGFEGILMSDAYSGYDKFSSDNKLKSANCNYHARRKWVHVEQYNKKIFEQALFFYQCLSQIESNISKLPPEEKLKIRERDAIPILEEFKNWIIKVSQNEPNKSPIKKAANYCLKRWDKLTYYTKDGRVPFSTNDLERQIRNIAIGRKNFLHASSEVGADAVAIFYSFVLTCGNLDIDPFIYLSDVLRRVGEHPAAKIQDLLPHNWKDLFMADALLRYQSPLKDQ